MPKCGSPAGVTMSFFNSVDNETSSVVTVYDFHEDG